MTAERKHKETENLVKNKHSPPQAVSAKGTHHQGKVITKPGTHVRKVEYRTEIRKRRSDDFWINIGVVFFISVCLIILSWDVLLKGV